MQAEAPPGALFSRFKEILSSEGFRSSDVGFYFVHWLTDLAGAEPTPCCGSHKFVLRFPHDVFHSFIASFSVVGQLAHQSETAVFEEYLACRWEELRREIAQLGPPPKGPHAIALMRLVVQASTSPCLLPCPHLCSCSHPWLHSYPSWPLSCRLRPWLCSARFLGHGARSARPTARSSPRRWRAPPLPVKFVHHP